MCVVRGHAGGKVLGGPEAIRPARPPTSKTIGRPARYDNSPRNPLQCRHARRRGEWVRVGIERLDWWREVRLRGGLTPLAWRCRAVDLVRPKVHPHLLLGRVGQESPNRLKPRVAGLTVTEIPEPASWRIWSRMAAVGEPKILTAAF